MIGLPPYQTQDRWVRPTLRTVGAIGTQKGKSRKFLIYPPFQRPHAEYTATNVIPSIGAVAGIKSLPCRISQFGPYISQGSKN